MTQLRTLFYRCQSCGQELLNTVDLDRAGSVPSPELPRCHCGGLMVMAGIPRLVMPDPGDPGFITDVAADGEI